jgi:hypothetical protein
VGEWMAPHIFSFQNGVFKETSTNLNGMYGWWQTISVSDVNGDNKQDLILGNIGENFYLRPTSSQPVKLWLNDFDNNGITDKILTYTVDGKDKPVFLKHDLEESMPFLKKNNLKHAVYATKSVQELIPSAVLSKAIVKQFNYSLSCIAINNGNGIFTVQKLPAMAQLSSVNAIHVMDVNKDTYPDIILGGNQFNFLPQLERLDASLGDILINDGQGNMNWVEAKQSGFEIRGQVRDITEIQGKNKKFLLFVQNDGFPLLYTLKADLESIPKK